MNDKKEELDGNVFLLVERALCDPEVQWFSGSEKRRPYVQDNPCIVQVRKRIG